MSTTTAPASAGARTARIDRQTAMSLAAAEYERFLAQLRRLSDADWARPTECAGWDVRTMTGHVLGMAEMVSSTGCLMAQNMGAMRAGGGIDALTGLQVRKHASDTPDQLIAAFQAVAPKAVRGRRRLAGMIGALPLPEKQLVGGEPERWRFGFLFDVILTRDVWTHRGDIARATGREMELTADHDGPIVADVVAEWAQRHGRPYRLHLTGPAGGEWSAGTDGEHLELDAVEFCRILSGRGTASGLLTQQVPF